MAVNREQVVQAAEKLVARGKIEAAIKEYRKVLEDAPSDTTTLNRVGDLWARLNKNEEAIKVYTQTAASFTEDGFFVKAIAIYKKVIKLDPTRLEVYEKLADLYHRQGLTNEARTQYQVLIDYYLKHQNAASAISILLKMAQLEPENPTHHVKLAEIYKQQKLVDKAMGEYRIIAEMMLAKGHADEAAQVYLKALDVNPNDMAFLTEAVLGLRDAGHVAPAARLLAAAVEKNPQAEKVASLAGMRGGPRAAAAAPVQEAPAPPPPSALPPIVPQRARQPEPEPQPEPPAPPQRRASAFDQRWEDAVAEDRVELPEIDLELDELEAPALPEPAAAAAAPAPREDSFAGVGDDEFVLDLDSDEPLPTEFRPSQSAATPSAPPLSSLAPPAPMPSLEPPAAPFASYPPPPQAAPPSEQRPFELDFDLDLEDEPAPAPPPAVAAAPLPDLELPQEIEWSFNSEDELAAPPPPAPAASSPGVRIDPDLLERTAAEVLPSPVRREEDLVAEAEVFAKYGLQEKAEERVREALQQNPRHMGAQALLITLLLPQGKHERVLQIAQHMAEGAVTAAQREIWAQTRQRLAKHGYRVSGDRVLAGPEAVTREPDRIADLLGSIAQTAATPPPPPPVAPTAPLGEVMPTPSPEPAGKARKGRRPESALADIASEFLKAPKPKPAKPAPPAVEPPRAAPAAAPSAPPAEELLPALPDDDLEGIVFPEEIAAAASAVPPPSPKPPAPDASLSWLDDVAAPGPGAAAAEEKLFDDEDDFFDLAAELERELTDDDGTRGPQTTQAPQEQSLEEIVEGFKRGVAENLSPEDYDTHFNLGIAYREMGLLDEAIGEFQLASKDAGHLVECCSMLGICFLDKGLPELAVKWYRRGLEAPNLDEDRQLGLLYDMGAALAQAGDRDAAYKTFVEIYGVNSNYRDVVARLEELGHR